MPDAPGADALAAAGLPLDLADGVTKYLGESRTSIEVRGRRGAARGGWDKLKSTDELEALKSSGAVLDLVRYKSGGDGRLEKGYILAERVLAQSDAVQVEAKLHGGIWTVLMVRPLTLGTPGSIDLSTDALYHIGIAVHDDHSSSRFHHVSWQYKMGFDNEAAELNARRISH
jgi:hypothetical protein